MINIPNCWVRLPMLATLWVLILWTVAAAEVVERIVAIVNDEIITQSEVDQMAKAIRSQPGVSLPAGGGKDLQQQLLESLIMQKLARAEAKRRDIKVSEKEVNQAFEDFKKRNRIENDEALAQVLAKNGLSIKEFKQQIEDQMINERLLAVVAGTKFTVSDAEVRSFYEQQYPKTGGAQLHLKILNLPFSPGASEAQKEEVKKKAEVILEELRKGVSLDELRQKHSLLVQDLGFVTQTDLDPKLAQLLTGLKAGQVAPVQTLSGFQLMQVVARREGQGRSFEEAAPEIRNLLQRRDMEKHFNEWIKTQKERAHIKILM